MAAAGDEAASFPERREAGAELLAADVLDDDVDAAATRRVERGLGDVLVAIVDDVVGAVLAGGGELLVTARGRDHRCPGVLGDLHGRVADAAAGRAHEHGFARAKAAALDQHVPGSREDDLTGCGGVVGDGVRERKHTAGG